jgi:hypothetical protein
MKEYTCRCGSLPQHICRPATNFWLTSRAKQALANQHGLQEHHCPVGQALLAAANKDGDYITLVNQLELLLPWDNSSGAHVTKGSWKQTRESCVPISVIPYFYFLVYIIYVKKYCDREKYWSEDFDGLYMLSPHPPNCGKLVSGMPSVCQSVSQSVIGQCLMNMNILAAKIGPFRWPQKTVLWFSQKLL